VQFDERGHAMPLGRVEPRAAARPLSRQRRTVGQRRASTDSDCACPSRPEETQPRPSTLAVFVLRSSRPSGLRDGDRPRTLATARRTGRSHSLWRASARSSGSLRWG
jgi:hypothetical protein